jgi:hypothetical protein
MAELIQFNCPACGTLLRLPLTMAARQGPCPNCDREIVAPDPYRGFGAYEIPLPPPPKQIEPFRPFAEPPIVAAKEPEIVAAKPAEAPPARVEERPIIQAPACARPMRHVLIPSCLASALIGGIWGYALAVRLPRISTITPPAASQTAVPPAVEKPTAPAIPVQPNLSEPVPEPALVKPAPQAPKVEKPPEPARVSAAAEASLKAFLEAPDWASRCSYVLSPETVRPAMEAYSHEAPDGPTTYQSVSLAQSAIDDKTGNTLFIFNVKTSKSPDDIPVVVKETPGGWLVDWQSFVEFRDALFKKFVDGPFDKTGQFHLLVTAPAPDRAAKTENEHFSSFLLESPVNGSPQLAFVRKTSEGYGLFESGTKDGGGFTPVLEVAKRKTTEGQAYFEVTRVLATSWQPQ